MWEFIGVASYLLIGFWLTRVQANKAAVQAITVNRVGDTVITIGFLLLLAIIGNLDYALILANVSINSEIALTFAGLLLFGGAISKSAQVPLHTWLPSEILIYWKTF